MLAKAALLVDPYDDASAKQEIIFGGYTPAVWFPEADNTREAADALRGLYRLAAFALTLPIVGLLGVPLLDGVIRLRRWFSAESLALAGVGAAFLVSTWNTFVRAGPVYYETVGMVLVLFTLGRWLESHARARTATLARSHLGSRRLALAHLLELISQPLRLRRALALKLVRPLQFGLCGAQLL